MKISPKALLIVLALSALATETKADTVVDNFDTDHDYGTSNVAGTIWSGILFNGGVLGPQDAVLTHSTASGGMLDIRSTAGAWDGTGDDGYFLYLNVTGDFTMTTQVYGMQVINYNTGGLMVRDPDTTNGENWFQTLLFPQFSVGQHMRYSIGSVQSDGANAGANTTAGWLEVTRVGNLFESLYSADGITYTVLGSQTLDNMPATLQVGVFQASFSNNEGGVAFDNFSLTSVPEPGTCSLLVGGMGLVLFAVRRRTSKI